MGANPITYAEIEAYCRMTFARPTVWEVKLLRRVDAAVLAVWAADLPKSGKGGQAEVPVTDTQGVKALLLSKATVAR